MPNRAILSSKNDFKHLEVILTGLDHLDTCKFSSSLQWLVLCLAHFDLMDAIRQEVCIEYGI